MAGDEGELGRGRAHHQQPVRGLGDAGWEVARPFVLANAHRASRLVAGGEGRGAVGEAAQLRRRSDGDRRIMAVGADPVGISADLVGISADLVEASCIDGDPGGGVGGGAGRELQGLAVRAHEADLNMEGGGCMRSVGGGRSRELTRRTSSASACARRSAALVSSMASRS